MKKVLLLMMLILGILILGCTSEQSATSTTNARQPVPTTLAGTPPTIADSTSTTYAAPGAVKEFTITARNWEWEPSEIRVSEGDTVKLTITAQEGNHGFAIQEFGVNEAVNQGQTINVEFVADKKGEFRFYCSVPCGSGHRSMDGTLIVE